MVKKLIKYCLNKFNYDIVPKVVTIKSTHKEIADNEFERDIKEVYDEYKQYTMTSPERISSVVESAKYISINKIEGDVVECGVWKGGSMMAIARTLVKLNDTSRYLFLYDTFHKGMTKPAEFDESFLGQKADEILINWEKDNSYPTKDEVWKNMLSTGYPKDKIILVEGMVENTIPETKPKKISILRLDTDWYESTKFELKHLYPRLSNKGVLIIDDYGHWKGARKAVDEYIKENELVIFLSRIDYTGRLAIKN